MHNLSPAEYFRGAVLFHPTTTACLFCRITFEIHNDEKHGNH